MKGSSPSRLSTANADINQAMHSDDKLHSTLKGLSEHGLWAEMIDFGMTHLHAVRRERPLLKLLVEAYCREIFQVGPERAVELDRMFRSLEFPGHSPFSQRWNGCRQKALGRTRYAEWMSRGLGALRRNDGNAAMDFFAEALKLDPYNCDAFKGQEKALGLHLQNLKRNPAFSVYALMQMQGLLEEWIPKLSKPSAAFSSALDLLAYRQEAIEDLSCMADAPFDWPLPFWRRRDTLPTRRHPWSLLGRQIWIADRKIGGQVAALYAGEDDPAEALPEEGRGLLDWAYALRPLIPPSSPARLRLSDFHRNWGSQEYADKLLFACMKRRPGCPLGWLHLAVSFYVPHKTSIYLSSLCKAALLLTPEHPLYVRTHLFLAREYHDQKKHDWAIEEYRIAKGGQTRIPLDRLSFRFRRLLQSLEHHPPLFTIPEETIHRYRQTAKEAESYADRAME